MPAALLADATPAVLRWARDTAGLDLASAAARIGVADRKLAAAEAGTGQLTFAQLRKAAGVYKRALAVFYLPAPPADEDPVPDFRRHRDAAIQPLTPGLRYELRRLALKRRVAADLADERPDWGFVGSVRLGADIDAVAKRVRVLLGLDQLRSAKFKGDYDMFGARRRAIEAIGVLVFVVRRISVDEVRGFCLAAAPWPVIAVVRQDSPRARVFTLVHEFVHILLARSALCDDFANSGSQDSAEARSVEAFCNKVAAEALMPAEHLRPVARQRPHGGWTETELRPLANSFGVSMEAMLIRLVELQLAPRADYEAFELAMSLRPEPEEPKIREAGHETVLRTLGGRFVRMVLNAMHSDSITAVDASDYLDMNLKHLDALERSVVGGG